MYSLFSQLTLHYPLHISQTLYFCHLFKVFLYVFHSLCCNILWAAEPLQTFSLKIQATAPFFLFCPESSIVLYSKLNFTIKQAAFQQKQQGILRSQSLMGTAEEVFHIDPCWLPHSERDGDTRKKETGMYAEMCEQHLQSGSLGRGWNGKGGGRKNGERGNGCVLSPPISLWERESGGESTQKEGRGVCVCSLECVCVWCCSNEWRGGMTAVSQADGRARAGDVRTPLKR